MLISIEDTYTNGRIELKESPPVNTFSRVFVSFLEEEKEDVP